MDVGPGGERRRHQLVQRRGIALELAVELQALARERMATP